MSTGKTLEDLIKEHKEEDENKKPKVKDRSETEEEKKIRESRLKAMQSRMTGNKRIDDRGLQTVETNPYKSSEGKNERVLEARAKALLNKKNQLEESILEKEKEEKEKNERINQLEEEAKLHRTESQKQRANQVFINGFNQI